MSNVSIMTRDRLDKAQADINYIIAELTASRDFELCVKVETIDSLFGGLPWVTLTGKVEITW